MRQNEAIYDTVRSGRIYHSGVLVYRLHLVCQSCGDRSTFVDEYLCRDKARGCIWIRYRGIGGSILRDVAVWVDDTRSED